MFVRLDLCCYRVIYKMWPNFVKSTILTRVKQLEFLSWLWHCLKQRMILKYFLGASYNFMYLECTQSTIEQNFKFYCCFWELNNLCVKCAQMVDFPKFGHKWANLVAFPYIQTVVLLACLQTNTNQIWCNHFSLCNLNNHN